MRWAKAMAMKADSAAPSWQRHSSARRPSALDTERIQATEEAEMKLVIQLEKMTIHARFG